MPKQPGTSPASRLQNSRSGSGRNPVFALVEPGWSEVRRKSSRRQKQSVNFSFW